MADTILDFVVAQLLERVARLEEKLREFEIERAHDQHELEKLAADEMRDADERRAQHVVLPRWGFSDGENN